VRFHVFRHFRIAVLLLALASFSGANLRAQSGAGGSPAQVVREFYAWYMRTMNAQKDPFTDGRPQLRLYVTPRLLKQIDQARKSDDLGADPFLDTQDFDETWVKNITVWQQEITGKRARVEVQLKGPETGRHKLRVTLLQSNDDSWKIDKAEAQ